MVSRHVAVINESENLSGSEVAKAAAAVQKQVTNDFGPIWDVDATVDVFPSLNEMPHGYWPVVVRDDIGINLPGIHLSENGEKAFALVLFTGRRWTMTLSHEILDLLADPFGKAFVTGPSVQKNQGTVEYLVEVCDPCQSEECGYVVNGTFVSDFVQPAFYKGSGAARYSFAGHLAQPRTVCQFCYMTWRDPASNQWWQLIDEGSGPKSKRISVDVNQANVHLRGLIDRATDRRIKSAKAKRPKAKSPHAQQKRLQEILDRYTHSTAIEAKWWKRQIDTIGTKQKGSSF